MVGWYSDPTAQILNSTRLTRGARPAFGQLFRACSTHALDSPSTISPPRGATRWAQNPNSPRVRVRRHKLSPQCRPVTECGMDRYFPGSSPGSVSRPASAHPTAARNTPGLCSMAAIFHAPYSHATAMCSAACPVVATMVPKSGFAAKVSTPSPEGILSPLVQNWWQITYRAGKRI